MSVTDVLAPVRASGFKFVYTLRVAKYIVWKQVAYETELSGTPPTAVFREIQLIGQFLGLGIIILI